MAISNEPGLLLSSTGAWLHLLNRLLTKGVIANARGLVFHELVGQSLDIDMTRPIMHVKARNLGYRFMAAEAAWILSGDNRLETIKPYSKHIVEFSDDGYMFAGAYGPMIRHQLPYIVRAFTQDPYTRQAVLTIWRPSPGVSKDIPCTISIQFLRRAQQLHCILNMRSSDLWLGAPYDWFNFSMLTAYVILLMRLVSKDWGEIHPGVLCYHAGSCHLYLKQELEGGQILQRPETWGKYEELNVDEFRHPQHLINHLWKLAERPSRYEHNFGLEVLQWKE